MVKMKNKILGIAIFAISLKEIKNPYLGKKMPTCGEVKEEIK